MAVLAQRGYIENKKPNGSPISTWPCPSADTPAPAERPSGWKECWGKGGVLSVARQQPQVVVHLIVEVLQSSVIKLRTEAHKMKTH